MIFLPRERVRLRLRDPETTTRPALRILFSASECAPFAKAGGLTPFASDGNIKILRQKGDQIIKIPFDYGEVEKGTNLEQNIILQPGDVVIVP